MAERNSRASAPSRNASVPTPRREGKPDIHSVAAAYLRELSTAGFICRENEVQHVCTRVEAIKPGESAAEFLASVKNSRIEVEIPKVILALGNSRRFFNGFLNSAGGSRVVFGFEARLAQEMSVQVADKIQAALALLGLETQKLPAIERKEASL